MSIHPGPIPELPNVSVDRFNDDSNVKNRKSSCFFLTHCHTDHMIGLDINFFIGLRESQTYLYCSLISKETLKLKYSDFEGQIKVLDETTAIVIPGEVPYTVTVTPIPAGHCPGSVMFLFETIKENILYTGDFRIEKGDIQKYTQLKSYCNGNKVLNKIYLDVTFYSKIYWDFQKRSESLETTIKVIKKFWEREPDLHVNLEIPAKYGYEFIFKGLGRAFRCKIHVDDFTLREYSLLPDMCGFLTTNLGDTQIHRVENCVLKGLKYVTIRLTAQLFRSNKFKKPKTMHKINDRKYAVCFSTHSSYSEIKDFLKHLNYRSYSEITSILGSDEMQGTEI